MPSYETFVPDLPWNAPPPDTTSLPGSTWYAPPTSPRPDRPVVSEASEEMLLVLAGRSSSSSRRDDLLAADVLHVDDRARPGDGHRFCQPADPQFAVDVRGEAGRQRDALADDRAEPGSVKVTL